MAGVTSKGYPPQNNKNIFTQKHVTCKIHQTQLLQNHKIATILASINGTKQELIIDSGSSLSILGQNFVPKNAKIIQAKTKIKGISNQVICVNTGVILNIEIAGATFPHFFYIIPTEATNAIFGMDGLRLHRAKLNLDNDTFSICPSSKPKIPTNKKFHRVSKIVNLYIRKTQNDTLCHPDKFYYIRPHTLAAIKSVTKLDVHGKEVFFEPNQLTCGNCKASRITATQKMIIKKRIDTFANFETFMAASLFYAP